LDWEQMMGASGIAKSIRGKWYPKELAKVDIGYRAGLAADKAAGYGPITPPPAPPAPAPPESIDEGAYVARDRSRRRARLANSGVSASAAPYSAAPKGLLGS
jgi:hypothetical protein